MRAVGLYEFGGPEVLQVVDLPTPEPGPDEIRVHVQAATVNPTDVGFRNGARAEMLKAFEAPYVPGMEIGGIVDAVGEGAPFAIGDEVMAIVVPTKTGRGAQSEYCVVPAASAAPVPAGWTTTEAATIPMNGLTVRAGLDALALPAGATMLVTGSAGAVGAYAIQLGKAEGLEVIALASPKDDDLVRSFGADHLIDRDADLASAIHAIAPAGVDAVFDAAVIGAPVLAAVRDGGAVAAVRPFGAESERDIQIHQVSVGTRATDSAALNELRKQAEEGVITARVAETYPPERAGEAQERLNAGGVRGRLLITF